MRSSRLLSILLRLQLRGRITAAELAREFEVAVRTVYRDLDALSAAGVPVHAERGRGGGIVLAPGWRTQLTGLTGPEARSVPLAGLHSAARDLGLGAWAAEIQPRAGAAKATGVGASRSAGFTPAPAAQHPPAALAAPALRVGPISGPLRRCHAGPGV
ncbi:MAG: HTH domain-containing protein [Ideonella sp. WA131b]|nr:HTH domain-containing protein [Ideonella sp. WA131b]